MLRFDGIAPLLAVLKFILSERLSYSLRGSDSLLFSEFINIVSILYCNFIAFIILLYTFLVISLAQYKGYNALHISFSKFSYVLSAFSNGRDFFLWNLCLGVNT